MSVKKRKPRVYVVQAQTRRNDAGQTIPKFDLSDAEDFGELVTLLDGRASPFKLGPVSDSLSHGLKDIQNQDFLLLVGNPVFIGLATAIASELVDSLRFLVWSGKEQRYIIVEESNDR